MEFSVVIPEVFKFLQPTRLGNAMNSEELWEALQIWGAPRNSKELWWIPSNSVDLQGPPRSHNIQKDLKIFQKKKKIKDSKIFQKMQKDSKAFIKIPNHSTKFQMIPKDSKKFKRFQRNPKIQRNPRIQRIHRFSKSIGLNG